MEKASGAHETSWACCLLDVFSGKAVCGVRFRNDTNRAAVSGGGEVARVVYVVLPLLAAFGAQFLALGAALPALLTTLGSIGAPDLNVLVARGVRR